MLVVGMGRGEGGGSVHGASDVNVGAGTSDVRRGAGSGRGKRGGSVYPKGGGCGD